MLRGVCVVGVGSVLFLLVSVGALLACRLLLRLY
jgi:hypothetical protein